MHDISGSLISRQRAKTSRLRYYRYRHRSVSSDRCHLKHATARQRGRQGQKQAGHLRDAARCCSAAMAGTQTQARGVSSCGLFPLSLLHLLIFCNLASVGIDETLRSR